MDKFYLLLATWLIHSIDDNADNYEIYKYGIQIGIEQGLFVITCITIALFINSLGAMLLFLLIFYLVRLYIKGFHFKKFIYCYLLSIVSASGVILLSGFISLNIIVSLFIIIFSVVIAFIFLLLQSRELETNEYIYYKKKMIINLSIIGLLTLISYLFAWKQGINVIMLTLVLVDISFVLNKAKHTINYPIKD